MRASTSKTADEPVNSGELHDILEIGRKFDSMEDVEQALKDFEAATLAQFIKRDSRTIESSRRRLPSRPLKDSLKYYAVTFSCVHQGQPCMVSKGRKRKRKSQRIGCPALIRFSVTPDGQQLSVVEINIEHNHQLGEESPHKRQLSADEVEASCSGVKKKGRKEAQSSSEDGTEQDNSEASIQSKTEYINKVRSIIAQLSPRGDFPGVLESEYVDDGTVSSIYFQDPEMKRVYAAYPEFLIIDTSCTPEFFNMPMYIYVLLAEDSNGDREIVAFFLVRRHDRNILQAMMDKFKLLNPAWNDTHVLMVDPDFAERKLLQHEFMFAAVQFGHNQVIQKFKQELRKTEMELTRGQRLFCMRLFRKLEASLSELEYDKLYQQLVNSGLETVIEYYNAKWHNNREEWVVGFKLRDLYIKGATPDNLKPVTEMLTDISENMSSPEEVVSNLQELVGLLREKRDHKASTILDKIQNPPTDSTLREYQEYTTPHAMRHIKKQLKQSWKVKVVADINQQSSWKAVSKYESYDVTVNSCPCQLFECLYLPCSHIFAVRRFKGLPLFLKEVVGSRWTMEHYKSSCRLVPQVSRPFPGKCVRTIRPHLLSHQEKYQRVDRITNELALIICDAPPDKFDNEVETVKKLLSILQNGSTARLTEIPETP
ncbi:uncharacterized protein LOC117292609 [Asterias rubens]|uniref:uncharacterized protein LOC117292609 n=1 Tax=Asterias rubens TaxID=7604 RepID=UPI0014552D7F|nr:uncharacterized protein LOC117292609 [Asterias rubens]